MRSLFIQKRSNEEVIRFLEWLGMTTGLSGAWCLAWDFQKAGFMFFLLSNFCWLITCTAKRAYPMLFMQIGFTFSSVVGLARVFTS